MTTTLSDEEFQRMNEQLCELKNQNYAMEANLKKALNENQELKNENSFLKKVAAESNQQQKLRNLNPFTLAKNIVNKVDTRFGFNNEPSMANIPDRVTIKSSSEIQLKQKIEFLEAHIQTIEAEKAKLLNFDTSREDCVTALRESIDKIQEINKFDFNKFGDLVPALLPSSSNHSRKDDLTKITMNDSLAAIFSDMLNYYENKIVQLESIIMELCEKIKSINEASTTMVNSNDNSNDETIVKLQKELETFKNEQGKMATLHAQSMAHIEQSLSEKIEFMAKELDKMKANEQDYLKQITTLRTKVIDCEEERKISEKRGLKLVKELKKQLNAEKKRADKLQNILVNEDVSVVEESNNKFSDLSVVQSGAASDKCSSTGSWSYMNEPTSQTVMQTKVGHDPEFSDLEICDINKVNVSSSSTNPPLSPAASPSSPVAIEMPDKPSVLSLPNNLEQENIELLEKISMIQQEKWNLEERVNMLEGNLAQRTKNPINKFTSKTINDSILKVVNYIKEKSESTMANVDHSKQMNEAHRKLQRMVEEILTKNMHLQTSLEEMSDELMAAKQKLKSYESGSSVSK